MPLSDAKNLLEEGKNEDALRVAQLELWGEERSDEQKAEAYAIIGRAQLRLNQYAAAVHSLARAMELGGGTNPDDQVRVEIDLGAAHLWMGDLASAHDILTATLARPALPPRRHGDVVYNLGIIEEVHCNFGDAVGLYLTARDLYRQVGETRKEFETVLSIIWCHLMQEQPDQASPWLDELPFWKNRLSKTPVDELAAPHRAFYYRQLGDLSTSMQYCERAISSHSLTGRDVHNVLGEVSWIAGLNAFDMEHFHECRMFAQNAVQHALQLHWPSLLNRANKLRRRAEAILR